MIVIHPEGFVPFELYSWHTDKKTIYTREGGILRQDYALDAVTAAGGEEGAFTAAYLKFESEEKLNMAMAEIKSALVLGKPYVDITRYLLPDQKS